MRFLIVKALAESHAYSQFANALSRGLEELGQSTSFSDMFAHAVHGTVDSIHLARELAGAPHDAVISFSSFFGAATDDTRTSLFDVLGVKFIGWQLDHPIYAPQSLTRRMRNQYSIYANHNHLRFVGALKIPGQAVSMLAGGEPLDAPMKAYRSRQWPVFVAATWNGVPERYWESLEDSPAKQLLTGVVDSLSNDPEASLLDAFNDTSHRLGLGAALGADPEFDDQMIEFLRGPLTYIRHVDRINIVRALAESGLPVTICGSGWREYLGDRNNVVFIERRVDFKDMPAFYNDAKIVINLNAGNGACERAVHAMLAGAAVVSDMSMDLSQTFRSGQDIRFFNRAAPGGVVAAAERLLDGDRGEDLAASGHERAMTTALWRHRAQSLIEFVRQGP
ncbi:MAG TPA: glycosyltransferase [Caulobacteraceae bacterium]|jgi:hypothetical protein|nr:glycosyltransferase [Caulobacteraceae bacterium]